MPTDRRYRGSLTLVGGSIVLTAAAAAFVRDEGPGDGSGMRIVRIAAIVGAVLYTALPVVHLF